MTIAHCYPTAVPTLNFNWRNKLRVDFLLLLARRKLTFGRLLPFLLLHRWPPIQSARTASPPAGPASAQAASVHHVPEPQLTGQSEEPEPAAHSRPGGRPAKYGGMRPAAGQLGPGQQCGPGEQVSDPWWPAAERQDLGTGVVIIPL